MIRLAYLVVLAVGLALAYGLFWLVGSGGSEAAAPPPQNEQTQTTAEAEVAPDPADTQLYFLRDQDLASGDVALILYGAGPDATDIVVRDQASLTAAQDTAFFTNASWSEAIEPDETIAALYRGDALLGTVQCPAACDADASLDGLLDTAQPLIRLEDRFDDFTQYLDAITAIEADPDFAFLDLRPKTGLPAAQQTPSMQLALPTIVRSADQPLDTETHRALLTALVRDLLPDGASLDDVTVLEIGPAVVVDRDNGRPLVLGDAEIMFPEALFYAVTLDISGSDSLPQDVLDTLSDQTMLRIDWQDSTADFIATLDVECADCLDVQVLEDLFDAATITASTPEAYTLTYYDLREAP